MTTHFTYNILTYTHSPFRKERLNVGVLFYFKEGNYIIFKHPKGFKKLRDIYPDFQEWQLKSAIHAIEEKVNYLNNEQGLFSKTLDENEVSDHVLLKDSTVLKFSKVKRSVSVHQDIDLIAEEYYNLYFSDNAFAKKEKHDEQFILKSFKQKLYSENKDAQNYLQKDIVIEAPKTTVKFDYIWYNGSPNLIKPISFDLEDESSINHKAIFYFGQLGLVSDLLKRYNANIDLLITAPASGNPDLTRAYKKAVDILKDTNVKKEIIEEVRFDAYIEHISKEIHAPAIALPQKVTVDATLPPGEIFSLIPKLK